MSFKLVSNFKPCGDQPKAIQSLSKAILANNRYTTLLGVTGSGKTFTLANTIAKVNMPTLVISHNKTLAAQLYSEFKEFFPHNAVEYFVSYYDYYQPEAYIPSTDTYIEKDSSINEQLDRLRLSATTALMSRQDVIVVASVSCIYNLGSPQDYQEHLLILNKGEQIPREELIARLIQVQYERNDYEFKRGKIRVRGEIVEIFPSYSEKAIRIELSGDKINKISVIEPVSAKILSSIEKIAIYPAKHFVVSGDKIDGAIISIKEELADQLKNLRQNNKLLEAQRASLNDDVRSLRASFVKNEDQSDRLRQIEDNIDAIRSAIDDFSDEEKRAFLQLIELEVEIDHSDGDGWNVGISGILDMFAEKSLALPSVLSSNHSSSLTTTRADYIRIFLLGWKS